MYPTNTGFLTYDSRVKPTTEDTLTSLSEVAKLQSKSSELKDDESIEESSFQD